MSPPSSCSGSLAARALTDTLSLSGSFRDGRRLATPSGLRTTTPMPPTVAHAGQSDHDHAMGSLVSSPDHSGSRSDDRIVRIVATCLAWPPEHPRWHVSAAHPLQPWRYGCDGSATWESPPLRLKKGSLEMTHHDHQHRQRGNMDWDEDDERGHRGYQGDPRRFGGRGSWSSGPRSVWRLGQRRRAGRVCRRWL